MKISKLIVTGVAAMVAAAAQAAAVVGEVGDDFTASLEYAKQYHVPIAVAWGNTKCSYCCTLEETIQDSEELAEWLADKQILFVSKHEDPKCTDEDYVNAGKWVQSLSKTKTIYYPFIGLYWLKSDGTVEVSTYFTARKNQMPVKTPKNDLAGQLVNTLEEYFGSYDPGETPDPPVIYGQSEFVNLDTDEDRLEVVAGVDTVYVQLTRDDETIATSNTLKATSATGIRGVYGVCWEVGEKAKTIPVAIAPTAFSAGKKVVLRLYDQIGTLMDTSHIYMVKEPTNSPTNPHWIGDYSATSLPYGEWTMDYETAKEKLQTTGGHLMAVFSGVKWCPHCIGIDDSLFADSKFYSWAKKNKVLLVLFDQPRWNSADVCQYAGPRLLSTDNAFEKSGAAYLSRNGLSGDEEEVTDAIDMQWRLTQQWLAPEATASRLSNPTVLMLNDSGTAVAARMNKYELSDRTFPTAENIYRLDDLITLQDADEREGYRTVTPLELEDGDTAETTLHINARTKFFTLNGVEAGEYLKVTATSTDKNAQAIKVTIYSGEEILVSGTLRAITSEPVTEDEVDAGLSVKVESFAETAVYGKKTSFATTVSFVTGDEEMVRTVDFSSITKAEQKLLNPCLYSKRSATIPVYRAVDLGGKVMVGTLAVSVSSANKISAKFVGESSVSFSGTWSEINLMSGKVNTLIAKGDWLLNLAMNAEGGFEATLSEEGEEVGAGSVSAASDYSAFVGPYTVTLVDSEGENGTGYLSLKIAKTGRTTISGVMPNGVSISTSVAASMNDDGTITVPVYKRAKTGAITMALAIEPNAAETWGNEGLMDTVNSVTGCFATWTDANGDTTTFTIYGGYWKSGATPLSICELFDLSTQLTVKCADDISDEVNATRTGFKLVTKNYLTSLSFSRYTGVFSGKAKIVEEDGTKYTATVKGVLLPGWIDCGCTGETVIERPYGSGTLYYTKKVDGVKITVSMPIDIEATEAE